MSRTPHRYRDDSGVKSIQPPASPSSYYDRLDSLPDQQRRDRVRRVLHTGHHDDIGPLIRALQTSDLDLIDYVLANVVRHT